MKTLSLREQRALFLLRSYGVVEPSLSDWREALAVVDNCSRSNSSVKAKEHLGAYGLAKADLSKYTPVQSTGPKELAAPDALTRWLLCQPNALRPAARE